MDKEHQLAWMAGFADGESCIHIGKCVTKRKTSMVYTNYQLTFHISQKTYESCARFKEFFKCGSLRIEFRKGKPYWYWRATGTDASESLKQLLPYLFTKKREAENAIAYQEFKGTRSLTKGKKGSGYSVEDKETMEKYHTASMSLNQS